MVSLIQDTQNTNKLKNKIKKGFMKLEGRYSGDVEWNQGKWRRGEREPKVINNGLYMCKFLQNRCKHYISQNKPKVHCKIACHVMLASISWILYLLHLSKLYNNWPIPCRYVLIYYVILIQSKLPTVLFRMYPHR